MVFPFVSAGHHDELPATLANRHGTASRPPLPVSADGREDGEFPINPEFR